LHFSYWYLPMEIVITVPQSSNSVDSIGGALRPDGHLIVMQFILITNRPGNNPILPLEGGR
jgi:hypothetical protein